MNNWFVITGGPGSGKTTTIELLSKRGHKVTHESARKYFESEIQKGLTSEEIRKNPKKLQDNILRLQIETESFLDSKEKLFLDRATPDVLAYYDFHKLKKPDFIEGHSHLLNYKRVFFLERLPIVQDEVRIETDEEAQFISEIIFKNYSNLSLDLIKVPVMPREERVEYILSNT